MPFLGKWSGSFAVEAVAKGTPVADPGRNTLRGFLQLYQTGARYELHLDGEQEGLVSGGTWSAKNGRVVISPTSVKIDDEGGAEARNPNKTWIDPAQLREAYSRPLEFHVSKDGQRMTSVLETVGPLTGTYSFVREGFGR